MPPPSAPVAASREYVVPDGMRPTAAAKERGRYICFGRADRVPSVREARQIRS